MWSTLIKFVILVSIFVLGNGAQLKTQEHHQARDLSNAELKYLSDLADPTNVNDVLDNILIPRIIGTPNHEKVFAYILNQLKQYGLHVNVDQFDQKIVKLGKMTFKNIVATLNPDADRYLTLACHYDSKYFENDIIFLGATDSAVPCAMLLNLVKVLQKELERIKDRTSLSLQLMFFDGEEAIQTWGPGDSIYGSRHLADIFWRTRKVSKNTGETFSDIDRMDMMVLLDLIGHKQTMFHINSNETYPWYLRLMRAEDRLHELNLLDKSGDKPYFINSAFLGSIEDDHVPFARRKVPILHLISYPFPDQWHTPEDNRDIIDMPTVENLNKIMRVFVCEYLNLLLNQS